MGKIQDELYERKPFSPILRWRHNNPNQQCWWSPTSPTTSNKSTTWGPITSSQTSSRTWSQSPANQKCTDKNQTRHNYLLFLLWCPSSRWLHYSRQNGRPNLFCLHSREGYHVLSWSNQTTRLSTICSSHIQRIKWTYHQRLLVPHPHIQNTSQYQNTWLSLVHEKKKGNHQ